MTELTEAQEQEVTSIQLSTYEGLYARIKEETSADGVAIMIINGTEGNGFSIHAINDETLASMEHVFTDVARQIHDKYAPPPEVEDYT